jgi:hypothetical protein
MKHTHKKKKRKDHEASTCPSLGSAGPSSSSISSNNNALPSDTDDDDDSPPPTPNDDSGMTFVWTPDNLKPSATAFPSMSLSSPDAGDTHDLVQPVAPLLRVIPQANRYPQASQLDDDGGELPSQATDTSPGCSHNTFGQPERARTFTNQELSSGATHISPFPPEIVLAVPAALSPAERSPSPGDIGAPNSMLAPHSALVPVYPNPMSMDAPINPLGVNGSVMDWDPNGLQFPIPNTLDCVIPFNAGEAHTMLDQIVQINGFEFRMYQLVPLHNVMLNADRGPPVDYPRSSGYSSFPPDYAAYGGLGAPLADGWLNFQ